MAKLALFYSAQQQQKQELKGHQTSTSEGNEMHHKGSNEGKSSLIHPPQLKLSIANFDLNAVSPSSW